jgi:hypothetical protein
MRLQVLGSGDSFDRHGEIKIQAAHDGWVVDI